MWITNGGFGRLFVVFARSTAEAVTAFLVERGYGVKSGKKNTRWATEWLFFCRPRRIFREVKVAGENVLGEGRQGHKVGSTCSTSRDFKPGREWRGRQQRGHRREREVRRDAPAIAAARVVRRHQAQDGRDVVRTYAIESLLYRIAGLVRTRASTDRSTIRPTVSPRLAAFRGIRGRASMCERSPAASRWKLSYRREHPDSRRQRLLSATTRPSATFRDARVTAIFEGTNELNRLLIPGMLVRRAVTKRSAVSPARRRCRTSCSGRPRCVDDRRGRGGGGWGGGGRGVRRARRRTAGRRRFRNGR